MLENDLKDCLDKLNDIAGQYNYWMYIEKNGRNKSIRNNAKQQLEYQDERIRILFSTYPALLDYVDYIEDFFSPLNIKDNLNRLIYNIEQELKVI